MKSMYEMQEIPQKVKKPLLPRKNETSAIAKEKEKERKETRHQDETVENRNGVEKLDGSREIG